ncbi:hypothetical protein M5689_007010 [Euphorbia peplus]|nr:hypothetical protein M5689_007010 [Euphorbia peplus]
MSATILIPLLTISLLINSSSPSLPPHFSSQLRHLHRPIFRRHRRRRKPSTTHTNVAAISPPRTVLAASPPP